MSQELSRQRRGVGEKGSWVVGAWNESVLLAKYVLCDWCPCAGHFQDLRPIIFLCYSPACQDNATQHNRSGLNTFDLDLDSAVNERNEKVKNAMLKKGEAPTNKELNGSAGWIFE